MASTVTELLRRRFGGKKGILPSGYTQLDYIIGNNAVISTGLTSTRPYKYECEIMFTSISKRQITGANGGNFFGINNVGKWQNGHASNSSLNVQANANQWYHVIQYRPASGNQTLSIDGNDYNNSQSYVENNIYIFATEYSNTPSHAMQYGAMKYFKIWQNDVLVRHYIPCIDPNNVVGMYDIVNGTFKSSANNKNFIASS